MKFNIISLKYQKMKNVFFRFFEKKFILKLVTIVIFTFFPLSPKIPLFDLQLTFPSTDCIDIGYVVLLLERNALIIIVYAV